MATVCLWKLRVNIPGVTAKSGGSNGETQQEEPGGSFFHIGHIAVHFHAHNIYVSHNPDAASKTFWKPLKKGGKNKTYDEEVQAQGCPPHRRLYIPEEFLNQGKLQKWWAQRMTHLPMYKLGYSNCYHAVREALVKSLRLDAVAPIPVWNELRGMEGFFPFPRFLFNTLERFSSLACGSVKRKCIQVCQAFDLVIQGMGKCTYDCCQSEVKPQLEAGGDDVPSCSAQLSNLRKVVLERLQSIVNPSDGDVFDKFYTKDGFTVLLNMEGKEGVMFRVSSIVNTKIVIAGFTLSSAYSEAFCNHELKWNTLRGTDLSPQQLHLKFIKRSIFTKALRASQISAMDKPGTSTLEENPKKRDLHNSKLADNFGSLRTAISDLEQRCIVTDEQLREKLRKQVMCEPQDIEDNDKFLATLAINQRPLAQATAMMSFYRKRATNAAYILVLGNTGVGKSSTLNAFFDSSISEVCGTSATTSCTNSIVELTIPSPCDELGINNSKLVILDTPGFNSTGHSRETYNPAVLTAIQKYFVEKRIMPTIILLVVELWDPRLAGELSDFTVCLRAFKAALSGTVLDTLNPNLVIVATKCCQDNVTGVEIDQRLDLIKQVVRQNLGLLYCPVVPAENKPQSFRLRKDQEFWTLPNGDHYPRNLFHTFSTATKYNDIVGHTVIVQAFQGLRSNGTAPERREIKIRLGEIDPRIRAATVEVGTVTVSSDLRKRIDTRWKALQANEKESLWLDSGPFSAEEAQTNLETVLGVRRYKKYRLLPRSKTEKMEFFIQVSHNEHLPKFYQGALSRKHSCLDKSSCGCFAAFGWTTALDLSPPSIPEKEDLPLGSIFCLSRNDVVNSCPFKNLSISDATSEIGLRVPSFATATYKPKSKKFYCLGGATEQQIAYRMSLLNVTQGSSQTLTAPPDQKETAISLASDNMEEKTPDPVIYVESLIKLKIAPGHELKDIIVTELDQWRAKYDANEPDFHSALERDMNKQNLFYVDKVHLGGQINFHFTDEEIEVAAASLNDIQFLDTFFTRNKALGGSACFIKVIGGKASDARRLEASKSTEVYLERLRLWRNTLYEDLKILTMITTIKPVWSSVIPPEDPFGAVLNETLSRLYPFVKTVSMKKEMTRAGLSAQANAKAQEQVRPLWQRVKGPLIAGSAALGTVALAGIVAVAVGVLSGAVGGTGQAGKSSLKTNKSKRNSSKPLRP